MKFLGVGLLLFVIQSILEVIFIVCFLYLGIGYLGIDLAKENFVSLIVNMTILYIPMKSMYLGLIYVIVFLGVSLWKKWNIYMINGVLSILLIILLVLVLGGNLLEMINPLISTVVSSIVVAFFGFIFRRKNETTINLLDD